MKITVLQGSPHKNGSSNMLADQFIKGAKESGHEIQILDCGMDGKCAYQDDNTIVRDALLNTDMVVFVTPIYYFGMSAQLKMVIDRFYSYTTRLSEKGLKAALITAAWDDNDDVMPYCSAHYEKLCRYMNFENCGIILGTGCGMTEMTKNSVHIQEAYQLGKAI